MSALSRVSIQVVWVSAVVTAAVDLLLQILVEHGKYAYGK
jgi:hypothetical protein